MVYKKSPRNEIKVWVRKSVAKLMGSLTNSFLSSSAFWIAIFTGVLMITSIQLCSISKMNKDILIANQRAYISLKTFSAFNIMDSKSQKLTGIRFFVEFENSGTTPTKRAVVKLYHATSKFLPKKFDFGDVPKPEKVFSEIIAPKATSPIGPLDIDIDTLNNVMQKNSHLFFGGWFIYRDVFTDTPTRLTEFCTEVNVERIYGNPDKSMKFVFTKCLEHNCLDEDCSDYEARIKWTQ